MRFHVQGIYFKVAPREISEREEEARQGRDVVQLRCDFVQVPQGTLEYHNSNLKSTKPQARALGSHTPTGASQPPAGGHPVPIRSSKDKSQISQEAEAYKSREVMQPQITWRWPAPPLLSPASHQASRQGFRKSPFLPLEAKTP